MPLMVDLQLTWGKFFALNMYFAAKATWEMMNAK